MKPLPPGMIAQDPNLGSIVRTSARVWICFFRDGIRAAPAFLEPSAIGRFYMRSPRSGLALRPQSSLAACFIVCGGIPGVACRGSTRIGTAPAAPPPAAVDLPRPDPPFAGVAERTLAGSKPDFPRPVEAAQGRPTCCSSWSTMRGSATPRPSAAPARRRRSRSWPRRGCATTASTSRRSARRRARRCSPAAITTPSASARSPSSPAAGPATTRPGRRARPASPRSSRATATPPPRSASGTSRPTTSRGRRPVRPLAVRPGVRLLLGLPRRRDGPVRPGR